MCFSDFLVAFSHRYPTVLASDFIRYAVGAGGVYVIVNLALSDILANRKIRPKTPFASQILAEIACSLRTVLIFAGIGTLIGVGANAGIIPIYTSIEDYGIIWLIVSTIILIVAHDAWF